MTLPEDILGRPRGNRCFTLSRHADGSIELWPQESCNPERGMLVALEQDGTIALPQEFSFGLDQGSLFDVSRRADGVIELRLQEPSAPSQQWYWTERWQRMEREADEDYAAGRYTRFDTIEDSLADLDADHETLRSYERSVHLGASLT